MNTTHSNCSCGCCSVPKNAVGEGIELSRRDFLASVGAITAGGLVIGATASWAANKSAGQARPPLVKLPLKIQPVLTYHIPTRRQATSWRSWGGLHTEKDVADEKNRINRELEKLQTKSEFPLEFLPLVAVQDIEQAKATAKGGHDVLLMFAASGGLNLLEALTLPDKWSLMFLRHKSGPVYLWYEIAHPRFLRKTVDELGQPGMDTKDVVVDSYDEILWRLRALYGLKNTLNKKIIAIGGAGGWGAGGQKAPEIARTLWKLNIIERPYDQLGQVIKLARQDQALVKQCQQNAEQYLRQPSVSLHTNRDFVNNAFVLYEVFKQIMEQEQTDAITIHHCMGTIMPMAETTACLPLSLLNDDGCLAFCESDFVVIPSGILLRYISGKPFFFNDPTYPHDNLVTLAHCTAPRKMDGEHYERTKVHTHFESDYGAAPKVEMKIGQVVTNLIPDFDCKQWAGFEGSINDNPFMDICRSQIDVVINGDSAALLREMKGFHWMTCYGNYLRETGYALSKIGVGFKNYSA